MSIYLFLFLSKNQFFLKCIEKDVVLRAEKFNTECYNVASATMYQRNYKEKGDVYLLPPTEEMETVPRINSKRRGRKAQRPTTERIQRSRVQNQAAFVSMEEHQLFSQGCKKPTLPALTVLPNSFLILKCPKSNIRSVYILKAPL